MTDGRQGGIKEEGVIRGEGRRDIGILGGTFDPVHHGHLRTALEVLETLGFDEMRLVPAGIPAHREAPRASGEQRLAMLRLAAGDNPRFLVDDRELRRAGPSYMVDTLASMREQWPEARLFLLLGADSFNTLPAWHRWRDLFALAHLVVPARPGWPLAPEGELGDEFRQRRATDMAALADSRAGGILPCELTPLGISSTEIRRLTAAGRSARYLMPDAVWDYIVRHDLYHRHT